MIDERGVQLLCISMFLITYLRCSISSTLRPAAFAILSNGISIFNSVPVLVTRQCAVIISFLEIDVLAIQCRIVYFLKTLAYSLLYYLMVSFS